MSMKDWFPKAETRPVTVRQAIGYLPVGKQGNHEPQVLRAWELSKPGKSLLETCRYVGSFQSVRLDPNKPSMTQIKAHLNWHYAVARQLTALEAGLIGSFPQSFQWIGGKADYKKRIGNSVSPLMMRLIAKNIISMLRIGKPIRVKKLQKIADYPAHLEACWQEHLAPRAEDAPTAISTFAGCGGSSLGYSMAGFRELLAVEWDDNAVATFKLNFPDVPVYHGDICKLSPAKCLELTGLEPGQLDVLDGSPPCQGFSTAGKRKFTDDRNQLFREFVRLLRGLQPRVFVMENVSGMVKGKMKLIFADILRELKASGYKVSVRLLNAMYFGVPQSRQRLIFVGMRKDLGIESNHPKAETGPVPVRRAFVGLADNKADRVVPDADSKTLTQMTTVRPGHRCSLHHSHHRLSSYEPSPTVDRGGGAGEWHIWHPVENRPITRAEVKRLSSFPDEYVFAGSISNAFERIGNSVPPLMMRSIARHIRQAILTNGTPGLMG